MSSNSLRVNGELFAEAQRQGELLSRSAAQQIEHWARIGAALEARGLSVHAALTLLMEPSATIDPPESLWAAKRAAQRRDLEAMRSGRVSSRELSWFGGGRARNAVIEGSPL